MNIVFIRCIRIDASPEYFGVSIFWKAGYVNSRLCEGTRMSPSGFVPPVFARKHEP